MRERMFGPLIAAAHITIIAASLALTGCGADTLAKVGDRTITKEEFDAYLRLKGLAKADEKRRDALLSQYLEREALAQAIEKSRALDAALVGAELDEQRRELLISRYFEKKLRESVSDEAIRNHYTANAEAFQEKRVRVAHVLVRASASMSETERNAKLTRAQEAHSKLLAGADFAKIAANYSEDTVSAGKGGDLGWLKEGAIDQAFSRRVFEMKTGDLSEPFQSAFGYHIVKVLEGPVLVKRALEEVSGDIRYRLRNELKETETKRLMSSVRTTKKKS